MCDECWPVHRGDRAPVRVVEAEQETCCYCGGPTTSGIYVRDAPDVPGHCAHPEES